MGFFSLLAACHVKEDAIHDVADYAFIIASSTGGNPADLILDENPEIDLIGSQDTPRRIERRADAIPVGGMDVSGEVFKSDLQVFWNIPQGIADGIHGKAVALDVPGPEGHACGPYAQP